MKITEYSPVGKPGQASKKKSVSSTGGDFLGLLSTSETESAAPAPQTSDIASAVPIDTLLTLQEIPDNELQKRQLLQEGKGALETLEKLRLGLLTGSVSGNIMTQLQEIARLKQHHGGQDANLDALIQDIELRAAVELAKLELASGQ